MSIDLHIHSSFSDGTMSPNEIVELAKKKGLIAISITDHDTTEGVQQALDAGTQYGLEVMTGIELSAVHGDTHIHLLGYCFNHRDHELLQQVHEIQRARNSRNRKIIEKCQKLGIDISLAEVEKRSRLGQTGRPHIAQVLQDKGVVRSIDDAFARFLKKGAIAYVPRKVLTGVGAIELIRKAGGVPVLAHPVIIDKTLQAIGPLLDELVPAGLGGIEVYYPVHSRKNQKQLTALANLYGLAVSGGSDYHGDIRPGTRLAGGKNVHVPYDVLEQLKKSCRTS